MNSDSRVIRVIHEHIKSLRDTSRLKNGPLLSRESPNYLAEIKANPGSILEG